MVQLIEDRNLFFTQKVKKLDTHFKFDITSKIFKNLIDEIYKRKLPSKLSRELIKLYHWVVVVLSMIRLEMKF